MECHEEWLEGVTLMEYHEVDRGTYSSIVVDVGESRVSRTQG